MGKILVNVTNGAENTTKAVIAFIFDKSTTD